MFFFKHKEKSNKKIRKLILLILVGFLFFFLAAKPTNAQIPLPTVDFSAQYLEIMGQMKEAARNKFVDFWKKIGSITLQSITRNALNTFSYDFAKWASTGFQGQEPQWLTEPIGETLVNVADNAAGRFIETLSNEWDVNLCEPKFDVKLKIGLGLVEQQRPGPPDCTFTEMITNWKEEVVKPDFLKKLVKSFDPTTNNLGMAMQLQTNLIEKKTLAKMNEETSWIYKEGPEKDKRGIGGRLIGAPDQLEFEKDIAKGAYVGKFSEFTGDAFRDALNVFVNQLSLELFNNLMRTISEQLEDTSSPYGGDFGGLLDYEAGPYTSGVFGAKEILKKIAEPKFNTRGDYEILGELSMCNEDQFGVGPTNCVLDERFKQAIQQQKTVGEAVSEGYLREDLPFGFITSGDSAIEPRYNEGIPYRSMLILRKFRIIPVGWEIAAEYIKDAGSEVKRNAYLGKMIECFDPDDSLEGYKAPWCEGLVDPNWVLKAPQNYCAKEGYGPQIIFEDTIPGYDDPEHGETDPKYIISRADTYCSDEQSCIKERDDGSCEYFGYCSEEKRKWKFFGDSCEPVYNSCQKFTSEEGGSIAYLKNTLAYCSKDQFGCEEYIQATPASYDESERIINWDASILSIYLNKEAGECKAKQEGCHEYIRAKANVGSNLIYNSDFEKSAIGSSSSENEFRWPVTYYGEIIDADTVSELGRSGNVLMLYVDGDEGSFYSYDHSSQTNSDNSVLPEGFVIEPEISYTVSADVYLSEGSVAGISIGRSGGASEEIETTGTGNWERISLTVYNNLAINANQFTVFGLGNGTIRLYIDNLQFEVGDGPTYYKNYREEGLIYEKVIPSYLEDVCYENALEDDYQLKSDAPGECFQYARKCSREEANCEEFTNVLNKVTIPAKTTALDYCLPECVGYSTYIQSQTNFSSPRLNYFISPTAQVCEANFVGCEEFTNLDKLAQGGEQKEYYSYLRQCVKPTEPGISCAEFYSWEGNKDNGQQLVKYSLEEDALGTPATTIPHNNNDCNNQIFNASSTSILYNPDCREFYSRDGDIYYRLYSRTISCSENCHPYRMSYKNTEERLDQAGCERNATKWPDEYHWDNQKRVCYYCANGGYWSDEHNACIYKAIEEESRLCGAPDAGCVEYNGNSGGNVNMILNSTFENDNLDDWLGSAAIFLVDESVIAGQQSIYVDFDIENELGHLINENSSYVVSFLAKGDGASVNIDVRFENGAGNTESFGGVTVMADIWNRYELNLIDLNHEVDEDEKIVLVISGGVFLDNIRLSEVIDRHFLIRDSWNTPDACDMDLNGNPYPLFMLGCAEYTDRFNAVHYLHNFSNLCQESAVGCEAMIDTYNYSSPEALTEVNGRQVDIPADWTTFVVYDLKKQCNSQDKGCERLGEVYEYSDSNLHKEVYLKNDPDQYDKILCDADGVGCDRWKSSEGDFYFKDPKDIACEYRQAEGEGKVGWSWFKKRVKRCAGTGNICLSEDDCPIGVTCQLEDTDDPCPTDNLKTFGFGGIGNETRQPAFDGEHSWAGLCPASQSGCSEYIDPVSKFSANILYNPDFSQDIDGDEVGDGWGENLPPQLRKQIIKLEGNNLYILTVDGNNEATIIISDMGNVNILYELDQDNELVSLDNTITVGINESKIFYVERNIRDEIGVDINKSKEKGNNSKIILRKAVLDYQTTSEVDRKTCNGVANFDDGCIWFNERGIDGSAGITDLNNNAWDMYNKENINSDSSNSNQLIKVRPDRVCNTWLACKSYIKNEEGSIVCFDIGACNRLDEGGNCANFVVFEEDRVENKTYNPDPGIADLVTAEDIKNLSGYVKVGGNQYRSAFKQIPNNLYDLGNMEQTGKNVLVPNGDFEFYDEQTKDVSSWMTYSSLEWATSTSGIMFSVIADPVTAQGEGIAYPMVGKSFLRYNAGNENSFPTSEIIYIDPGEDYYISFYINTLSLRGVSGSEAEISLLSDYGVLGVETVIDTVTEGKDKDWTLKVKRVSIPDGVSSIHITLGATDNSAGNIYIDDIQITPVLQAKEDEGARDPSGDFYIRQSCRLYPEEDSLSCDYIDDSGVIQRGERGYCLEYDRYPGSPDACILWWPIDKVKGSGLASGVYGYSDRMPLYYCIGADNEETRPYINPAEIFWRVDESIKVEINGVRFNLPDARPAHQNDGFTGYDGGSGESSHAAQCDTIELEDGSAEELSDYLRAIDSETEEFFNSGRTKIYLNYGSNEIRVHFRADEGAGTSFLQFFGSYHYYANNYTPTSTSFNFFDMGLDGWSSSVGDVENTGVDVKADRCDPMQEAYCWENENAAHNLIVDDDDDDEDCYYNTIGGGGTAILIYRFNVDSPYQCTKLVNVVTRDGRNKAWSDRIRQGSPYGLACNMGLLQGQMPQDVYDYFSASFAVPQNVCSYNSDYQPFGSVVPPDGSLNFLADPSLWEDETEGKPLLYEEPEDQARMGQLHNRDTLPYLFAESYSIWDWNGSEYVPSSDDNWTGPADLCPGNERTILNENCAVSPEIYNIKVNGYSNAYIYGKGFIDVTFNSDVDGEQMPLMAYEIDWGDDERLSVSGVEMRDRPEKDNPHSAFHAYDYRDLLNKERTGGGLLMVECFDESHPGVLVPYCSVIPRVKIKDNWGWCSEARHGQTASDPDVPCPIENLGVCMNDNRQPSIGCDRNSDCSGSFYICSNGWYELGGEIIVYEQ